MVKRRRRTVEDRVTDLDLATFLNSTRKPHAQEVDRGTVAKRANNVFVWWADPSRTDFDGVDTPRQSKPKNFNPANARRKAKRLGLI